MKKIFFEVAQLIKPLYELMTLNRSSLKRQKYNLIKEIKSHYDIDKFFKHKLPNYKHQAALYTLIEIKANPNLNNIKHEINSKLTLLEAISNIKPR